MTTVSVLVAMIVFWGGYATYVIIFSYFPQLINMDDPLPDVTDLATLAMLVAIALGISFLVSLKLAVRILVPLNSLAESARRITAGDLTARAEPGDHSLGETANLVADFNTMAQKLQDMTADMTAWNAAIAHELRTPLTILRGRLQGIHDGVFAPDEKTIRNLLHQVDGLSRLVDDLRLVTLAASGRMELQIEQVALAEQIRIVADLVQPNLVEAGFTLSLDLSEMAVALDPVRTRQALLALLDNVRRYANPGTVVIAMSKLGSYATIRVEDSGPGLPPEFAKQAFTPFARADGSRSRSFGGSGLGLSVVDAIAKAHGGKARYRTSERGGAVFEMLFPIKA
ncbi:two-component system sensor histidine kinase AdeS [Rhizomicrobium palustre]|uniref:histidine kinase n=1 Tax=Rhizomicrobium palustre TaxID=189966 RepID=A0A846MUS9_9PROT|nr:ATP-binding protein [Rhizomicrobium palustre]NIK87113.1 two-component system sensor histidine kinase AdeS [Rhizomicrobium palustre]